MSVTAPLGFRAAAGEGGLRAGGGPDVALVVNDGPLLAAAGVLTRNRVRAAPVLWTEQVLKAGSLRAVLLNAGGANACTGPGGFQDAHASAETVALALGCGAGEVAVCSTGLIGTRLPMDRLLPAVAALPDRLDAGAGPEVAQAIMTTDSVPKTVTVRGAGFTVGGMAKGSGMLAPGLATMLSVLTTDAIADAALLGAALRPATARTFDRVDSDGCMSTNDTVLLLASGRSGVAPSGAQLAAAVENACSRLARLLVADAEGATKEVSVEVTGAATEDDAVEVGRAVARSNLLKCALYGRDPNWGRVLAAAGTTSAAFEPADLAVAINGVWVCRDGAAGEDRSGVDLSGRQVSIVVDLGAGVASAVIWTNDLSPGYVHENSAYST
jgi:glutamate N-acetyltransferase / amino-acid N-acetyltransferase